MKTIQPAVVEESTCNLPLFYFGATVKTNRLYFLPLLIWAALLVVLPFIILAIVSLYKTNFLSWTFVGVKNYKSAFTRGYGQSILNSFLYLLLIPFPSTAISLAIAIAMSSLLKRTQSILRALYYIPLFGAGIISSLFWRWVLKTGNVLVGPFAIPALSLVIIISIVGSGTLFFSLAIQNLDPQIIEAGKIDGASPFQIKTRLILPQLWQLFSVMLLFSMIGALQLWEIIYMLAPYDHTASMMFNVFQDGFQFGKYGLASAECIIMMLIILLIGSVKQFIEKEK